MLKEVPNVRKDLGYPPLVTPLSQMVGTQSVLNVITKERYNVNWCFANWIYPEGELCLACTMFPKNFYWGAKTQENLKFYY